MVKVSTQASDRHAIHDPLPACDPFDLLLIAQAQAEGIRIVTRDVFFTRYLCNTILRDG